MNCTSLPSRGKSSKRWKEGGQKAGNETQGIFADLIRLNFQLVVMYINKATLITSPF